MTTLALDTTIHKTRSKLITVCCLNAYSYSSQQKKKKKLLVSQIKCKKSSTDFL